MGIDFMPNLHERMLPDMRIELVHMPGGRASDLATGKVTFPMLHKVQKDSKTIFTLIR